jgi:hypothetical protein
MLPSEGGPGHRGEPPFASPVSRSPGLPASRKRAAPRAPRCPLSGPRGTSDRHACKPDSNAQDRIKRRSFECRRQIPAAVRPRANGTAGRRPGRPGQNGPVAAQPPGGRTGRCIGPDRVARRRESSPVPRQAWCPANTGWIPASLRTPPPAATVACHVPVSRASESASSLACGRHREHPKSGLVAYDPAMRGWRSLPRVEGVVR